MDSREQLRIFFRKHQIVGSLDPEDSLADFGNVVVVCDPSGAATYVPGDVDQAWEEMTDMTQGLDKLTLSWDADNAAATTTGDGSETNQAGSNYDKGISVELVFNDRAFQYIWDWMLADTCGTLNSIDVRIDDALCGKTYRTFEIKEDNLTYEPDDAPCEFSIQLREQDPVWHCVHKTFIWDNWQGWFEDGSAKQHPTFLTAVEPRPRLIASARMGLSIFGQTIPLVSAIFNENDNVFRRILNVDNFVEAPLVRDIISNVAGKCGLAVDTMFHDPANPYYDLCLYYPGSGAWHQNDSDGVTAPALWFHFDNRWDITLAEFLDKLKAVFKAEWYVTPNNTLVFQNKAAFLALPSILDFSATGTLTRWGLRYTFSGDKKPAYGRYQYTIDPSDLATQEIAPLYNDIVDYDGPAINQMLEGSVSDQLSFAATGFVRDGKARGDYMRDLVNDGETVAYAIIILLVVVIAAEFAGVFSAAAAAVTAGFLAAWVILIGQKANDLRDTFGSAVYTGAVRITCDQVGTPRLVLWDGASMNRAKCVAVDPGAIVPAPYYNPDLTPYATEQTFQYDPVGGLQIYNYPMYFDSFYQGNLFDRFFDALDNPLKSLDSNQTFEMYTDLCCEVLDALGAWEGDFAKIGYQVILERRPGYTVYGRIEHFDIEYEAMQIHIRGHVIKKTT